MDEENNVGVDVGGDKESDDTRITRSGVVAETATKTDAYAKDTAFKANIDRYVAAGAALDTARQNEAQARANLSKAKSDRLIARQNHDRAHAVAVTSVEDRSTTPADVKSFGFAPSQHIVRSSAVVAPSGILVSLDKKTGRVTILVQGNQRRPVQLEMSPDPITATSFKLMPGTAARRSLPSLAAGTYWFRAAVLGKLGMSDYSVPVQLVVH